MSRSDTDAKALRLYVGGVATETNAFSPLVTGIESFERIAEGDAAAARSRVPGGSTFARYAARAAAHGCDIVQGTYAFATPAGVTTRAAYEELRDELLLQIEQAGPVDAVLLTLHGAMVASGYEDCESDIVASVRALVGRDVTIGVLLDLHCDLPPALLAAADVIVVYKEYPHTDIDQRADELAELVIAAARGEIDPVMACVDCRMVGLYPTPVQPMRGYVDRLIAAERDPSVLSVSLGHGFPWIDAPAHSAHVLVVADGNERRARELADRLARDFYELREHVTLKPEPMHGALDRVLHGRRDGGPVVIADVSDNAGGGAPSDSTSALAELLARDAQDTALALMWDPGATAQAFAAGEGASLRVRLGGKATPSSGNPLDLTVTVKTLRRAVVQRWPQEHGFLEVPSGDCAALTCGGIDIVVGNVRQQVLGLEVFTALGIDPRKKALLVVKSANHFRAAFAPLASAVLYMNAPGALNFDPRELPYEHADTNRYPWISAAPW